MGILDKIESSLMRATWIDKIGEEVVKGIFGGPLLGCASTPIVDPRVPLKCQGRDEFFRLAPPYQYIRHPDIKQKSYHPLDRECVGDMYPEAFRETRRCEFITDAEELKMIDIPPSETGKPIFACTIMNDSDDMIRHIDAMIESRQSKSSCVAAPLMMTEIISRTRQLNPSEYSACVAVAPHEEICHQELNVDLAIPFVLHCK